MTIDKLKNGNLVLGLWGGGVVEIDFSKKEVLKEHFPQTNVYSFLQTDDGSLWAGTWGQGLYVKSENEEVLHFSGNGQQLSHPVVYSLMQNRSGIMWIGTNGGGICKVNPRKSNYVILKHNSDEPLSISNGKINVIYQDEKDKLYLGIYNQGLNVFETQEKSLKKFSADGLKGSLPD